MLWLLYYTPSTTSIWICNYRNAKTHNALFTYPGENTRSKWNPNFRNIHARSSAVQLSGIFQWETEDIQQLYPEVPLMVPLIVPLIVLLIVPLIVAVQYYHAPARSSKECESLAKKLQIIFWDPNTADLPTSTDLLPTLARRISWNSGRILQKTHRTGSTSNLAGKTQLWFGFRTREIKEEDKCIVDKGFQQRIKSLRSAGKHHGNSRGAHSTIKTVIRKDFCLNLDTSIRLRVSQERFKLATRLSNSNFNWDFGATGSLSTLI